MSGSFPDGRLERIRSLADRAVERGSERAMAFFRTAVPVERKSTKLDIVTEADLAVQKTIVEVLRNADDEGQLVAEEGAIRKDLPDTGDAWVIDPIDGTSNFARGNRLWAISVAYVTDGTPVTGVTAMPAMNDWYRAESIGVTRNGRRQTVSDRTDIETFIAAPIFGLKPRDRQEYERVSLRILDNFGDLRRLGSGQSTLAALACGELDAAISTVRLAPWDTIAGVHLVRAAGGRVSDLAGNEWTSASDELIASNGEQHDHLLSVLATEQ